MVCTWPGALNTKLKRLAVRLSVSSRINNFPAPWEQKRVSVLSVV
jgi:hypothetical protein